ncbi:ABC transporter substrate-binding protein [Ruania alba]|uniref:Multiple sugar transport system substrate-binding protein n=1 Tax=Ruania alba TaxID=648782 RepID=A0A1H5HJW5_9MICO|nr:extracellular solute-binding protein [Ruania alba]SEE28160.1 multiple sugar transport system substrate-binding protein [Ruania alba]
MSRSIESPRQGGTLSRRSLLHGTGALGTAGLLAACGGGGEGGGTSTGGGGNGGGGKTAVKVWTVPEGPSDEQFQREQFDIFMENNPDIEVELQFFAGDAYGNAMQLAYTGGAEDAPDVFRQSGAGNLLLRDLVSRGWIQPLDEFVTDDFSSRFPDWVMDPARSPLYVDGELYGVPRPDPRVQALRPMFYNIDILEDFGYSAPPTTWSEYREMAERITTDGDQAVYGTVGKNFLVLQRFAGPHPHGGDNQPAISLVDGEPMTADSSFADVVEFGQAMQRDGVFTPGWESWGGTDAIQQMAAGRLAMYMYPIFHANEIRNANPDINLGIAAPPMPDDGMAGTLKPNNNVMGFWFMNSETEVSEAAWRVLDFFGSVEFQQAAFQSERQISLMPAVYDGIDVDPDTEAFRSIAEEIVRIHPDPFLVDPAAEEFYRQLVEKGERPFANGILGVR